MYKFYKRESDKKIRNNILYANPFCHVIVMFRRKEALEVGGYTNIRFVEDWDLWLKLGKKGKLYNFQEYFALYMNAGQNLTVSNQNLTAKAVLDLIKKNQEIILTIIRLCS